MTRERLTKPITPLQRAPDAAPKARVSSRPVQLARLPHTLEAKPATPAQLEIQRVQALEVQRQADLEGQRASIQRAHDDRLSSARAAQTSWHASSSKSVPMQRAVAEHARSARAARDTRAAFVAQRSSENLETLVAQRLELQVRPALPSVQRQADLTLSHVADHYGDKAAVQLARDPERLSSYAGFKNAGAGLVKNFRTPGSTHTMPQLAEAIQRFREPMQRAAVQGAAFAAFGSHPTYPKQLQRALEERDASLNVQREAWQRELEPVAQRLASEEASGENAAGMIEAARGGGSPLPAGVRNLLETKWNTDLSKVCVHMDVNAQLICKKFNAKALTSANNIFFAAGMWNPTSLEGLQLIAHEAWHTVQQAGGLVEKGVDKNRNLELEAQAKGAELSSEDLQTASSAVATPSSGKESKAKRATRTASPTSGTPSTSSTQTATRAARSSKIVQPSATPAPTSLTATSTRVTGNLEGLASSAPIFGAPVQRAADGTVIQRAWWNPFDWAVEGAKWLGASFMHGLEWMGEKAAKVFMEVFAAAAKPFGATGKLVLEAIRNIGKPLISILENPGRFATNLIQGVKQGFMGFATNAPQHLTGVLGSFLGGKGLSLTFPTKLEPLPILMAFITTLNLGWDSIKAKIAKQLGPKGHQALALAEKSVPIVQQLSGGLHNSSEFTKEVLPTLKTQAVDGVKSAAQEGLIRAGINALLKLIPGAGTVMAIFDTVRVLIERAKDISSLVSNVMGAFGAIAGGNVVSAAVAVESSLVSGIRIALNFVAKLAKIDTFIERVRGIIGKVTTKISSVVNPLIAKAVKLVQPLLDKVSGKGSSGKPASSKSALAPKPTKTTPTTKPTADDPKTKQSLWQYLKGRITDAVSFVKNNVTYKVWVESQNGKAKFMMNPNPVEAHLKIADYRSKMQAMKLENTMGGFVSQAENIVTTGKNEIETKLIAKGNTAAIAALKADAKNLAKKYENQLIKIYKKLDDAITVNDVTAEVTVDALKASVSSAGGIVSFMKKIAAGATIAGIDRKKLGALWDHKTGGKRLADGTIKGGTVQHRGTLKDLFRDAIPEHHEWLPSNMMLEVIDRDMNAHKMGQVAEWIELQHKFRIKTDQLIFNANKAKAAVYRGVSYQVLQGHVGALTLATRNASGGTDYVSQHTHQSDFHDDLREKFIAGKTKQAVLSGVESVVNSWIWDGASMPSSPLHPMLRWTSARVDVSKDPGLSTFKSHCATVRTNLIKEVKSI